MSDVAISKLSARGSVIFTLLTCALMLWTSPKEFVSTFGWRFIGKGVALIVLAPVFAYVWQAHVGGPWYGLPLCIMLLYTAVLWSLFMQAAFTEAEQDARYFKGAWNRATVSWQECEQRVQALKNPPRPPADPAQLELDLWVPPRRPKLRRGTHIIV